MELIIYIMVSVIFQRTKCRYFGTSQAFLLKSHDFKMEMQGASSVLIHVLLVIFCKFEHIWALENYARYPTKEDQLAMPDYQSSRCITGGDRIA